MRELRGMHDPEFREGAVRIATETRKPIAQVARDVMRDVLGQTHGLLVPVCTIIPRRSQRAAPSCRAQKGFIAGLTISVRVEDP